MDSRFATHFRVSAKLNISGAANRAAQTGDSPGTPTRLIPSNLLCCGQLGVKAVETVAGVIELPTEVVSLELGH